MKNLLAFLFIIYFTANANAQLVKRDTLHFAVDKFNLANEAAKLNRLIKFASKHPNYKITITGHTDSFGTEQYNMQLGEKRALQVKNYLVENGLEADKILAKGYGESKPLLLTADKLKRKINRRVEIVCTIPAQQIQKPADSTIIIPVAEKFENDTIIYGERGTEIIIKAGAFYPHKIKEIDFNIIEVFTRADMILGDYPTVDAYGNCLESAGMIFPTATLNGLPIQPSIDSALTIRIPAEKFDTSMMIYLSAKGGSETAWQQTKTRITYDVRGRKFYQFVTNAVTPCNLDKPYAYLRPANMVLIAASPFIIAVGSVGSLISTVKDLISEEGITVKARRKHYTKAYLTSLEALTVLKGKKLNSKKMTWEQDCLGEKHYVGVFKRKGQLYMVNKPLAELKYRRTFNKYIVRKRDFVPVTIDEMKEALAKL